MDTLGVRPGSNASTARLSSKSGGEVNVTTEEDEIKMENDSLNNDEQVIDINISEPTLDSNNEDLSVSKEEKVSTPAETPQEEVMSHEKAMISETDMPVSAIPVNSEEHPKEESPDPEDGKIETGKKSPLTVDLPPEEKEGSSSLKESTEGSPRPQSEVHHTPTPMPPSETPVPLISENNEVRSDIESPVEKSNTSPQESEINETTAHNNLEKPYENNSASSTEGKNDSAISSSSSITPEKEKDEPPLEELQKSPVIEVT